MNTAVLIYECGNLFVRMLLKNAKLCILSSPNREVSRSIFFEDIFPFAFFGVKIDYFTDRWQICEG